MRVFFSTFGCKTNQYDTALLAQGLADHGFELARSPAEADWVVVNTCAVTRRGEDKARQYVRKIAREHPRAGIAVAGCAVESSAERFAGLPGVRLLLGTREKFSLGEFLARADLSQSDSPLCFSGSVGGTARYEDFPPLAGHPGRSRAFVKIQDGCDNACAYCVVPLVRGPGRSRRTEKVVGEVRALGDSGHAEVVLTGIHIGRYGKDLPGQPGLAVLLENLLKEVKNVRFRLSSLEVGELGRDLVGLFAGEGRLCRHFHIPLQHGSANILQSMGRDYTPGRYAETVDGLARALGSLGLGTDVIVGFPGETDREFEESLEFIRGLPFTYLHVFPFSPRPGTAAWSMKPLPPHDVVRARVKILRDLSGSRKTAFLESLLGSTVEVVRENRVESGVFASRAGNYARVYHHRTGSERSGRIYPLKVERLWRDGLWGAPVQEETRAGESPELGQGQ